MLPRDIWAVKGIMSGGLDSAVYREKIRELWGRYPLDTYACTEGSVIATQTWDYDGMTFIPNLNFLEFIPENECLKCQLDSSYQPRTLLLDELIPGQNYEIVVTNFHGGAFVRYRVGDMVKIVARRNEKLGIDIPQMVYHSRVDDMIDIAGFTRLTESVIWKALEKSEVPYADWAGRKELLGKPVLHLYVELKNGAAVSAGEVAARVHDQLSRLDAPYSELEANLGLKPIRVTLVPGGAFGAYMVAQQARGAELGRMKVLHINPSDATIDFLLHGPPESPAPRPEWRPEAVGV